MLTHREITGLWSARVPDGPDSDAYPDTILLEGHVTFEPEYRVPLVYPGEHIVIEPMHAVIHEGVLYGETVVGDDVVRGPLFLPVTVDDAANQTWSWVAKFQGMRLGEYGEEVTLPDVHFQVPAGEDPLDLSAVFPVSQSGGTITLRGPAGASVVGGRDNGDGTVTFLLSDGSESAPVAVPPGPEGRGVVSIVDPDGDGTATVTYSDGTTGELLLPSGPPGTPGEDGADAPLPDVSWDGPVLVVGGERSPDLTGPEGPAPAVSWDGPRLTVGGVVGPDLTGPEGAASTVPGPPGAVPTAADYAIVGPGRPDVPATTGGLVTASTPIGATYTSTDGAGVGAFVWRKRPDGSWAVIDGDTGWRTLPLIGTGHHSATRVEVRRQGATVRARALIVPVGSASGDIATVPQGFRFNDITGASGGPSVAASIRHGGTGEDAGTLLVTPNTIRFTGLSTAAQRHLARTDWGADDPWPNTLP